MSSGVERLRLSWIESGGPPIVKPITRGFGSRLISDGLAYELDGTVQLDYKREGLQCIIDAPLRPPETPL